MRSRSVVAASSAIRLSAARALYSSNLLICWGAPCCCRQTANFAAGSASDMADGEIPWPRSGGARQTMPDHGQPVQRSEEHTSELQSLMRISYAVFCLKKKKQQ